MIFFLLFAQGWGYIYTGYGVGVPSFNHVRIVEFGLGTPYVGLASMVIESFSFPDEEELTGSILPLYVRIPVYKKLGLERDNIYYSVFADFYVGGSFWGYRFSGKTPFDYIIRHEWLGEGDYFNIGFRVNLPFLKVFSVMVNTGGVIVKNGVKRAYLGLSFSAGTIGPISYYPESAELVISNAEFSDDNDGKINSKETASIIVKVKNKGTKVKRDVSIYAELLDRNFKRFLKFTDVTIKEIYPGEEREVVIEVRAGEFIPKIAYRVKITGKDMFGNFIVPFYLIIESE